MWVYIWTDEWTPWANTIAYYPLNSTDTVNDKSGNNRNLTSSTLSFGTYQWVNCAYGNQAIATLSASLGTFTTMTLSIYAYNWNSSDRYFCSVWGNWNLDITSHKATYYYNSWYNFNLNDYKQGSRQHLCAVFKNRSVYLYQNGSLISSGWVNWDIVITYWFWVWTNCNWGAPSSQRLIGWVSNFIIENKARSQAEITAYYNSTKANYGL